jgi:hypothetical protein
MTTAPIKESGMIFGPYPEGYCFYIEKSATYQKFPSEDKEHGVKIAEFLLLRQDSLTVWIIEAKSSSPHPKTQPNFDGFIEEIREKLTNALTLFVATHLKRHSTWEELPNLFQTLDLSKARFSLILVIKGHQEAWLPPLQDALRKVLKPTVKIWNLSPTSVVVINEILAQERGLII